MRHTCHWTGCGKAVPAAMWGCKEHWFKLPKPLRDATAFLVQEWIVGRIEIRKDGSVHPVASSGISGDGPK